MGKNYLIVVAAILLLLLSFLLSWILKRKTSAPPIPTAVTDRSEPSPGSPNKGPISHRGFVARIIDGDTIELEEGERVRYLGINTPEKGRPFYAEAMEANEILVAGQEVELELDIQTTDQYGRTLAYVWIGERMVNFELLWQGFANISTFPPNVKYEGQFLAAEREAQEAERGLWGLEF